MDAATTRASAGSSASARVPGCARGGDVRRVVAACPGGQVEARLGAQAEARLGARAASTVSTARAACGAALRSARPTLGRSSIGADSERNGRAGDADARGVVSQRERAGSLGIASSGTAIAQGEGGCGPRTGRRHNRAASTHSKPIRMDQQ